MFKSDIRTIFKDMRNELTIKDINYLSEKIRLNLFTNFNFNQVSSIHTFLPILPKGEVNTWCIIEQLNTFFKKISIIVPKMVNNTLKNYYINKDTKYNVNYYQNFLSSLSILFCYQASYEVSDLQFFLLL